ncbi:MAG: hypothetical protein ACKO01_09160, partial [Erythrobacter sp.]
PPAEAAPPAPPPGDEQPKPDWEKDTPPVDPAILEGRERPGYTAPLPDRIEQDNPGAVRAPPPEAFATEQFPIPDRWRLIQSLGLVKENLLDPYHQNTLKGDRPIDRAKVPWLPIKGDDWFFVASAVSDTVYEPRSFPIPVGVQGTGRPDRNDVFGGSFSQVFSQTFLMSAALLKGSTTYAPPTVEYRVTLAYNVNYVDVPERRVLFVEPSKPSHRLDHFLGVQEAFVDYHFARFDTERFDFISARAGIQTFQSDFRGFLFNDQQLGVRVFGSRDNNRFQFNVGAFWRLEKDTNSGLNSIVQRPRDDFVFVVNAYRQDFLIPALTSEFTVVYNMNRESDEIEVDTNGFPVRPALIGSLRGRDYDVVYLGYGVDGRVGRINLTGMAYWALGKDRNSFFTGRPADINAQFVAVEASYDRDWTRFRLSGAYASGDRNPDDDKETGFDAIFENPVFAGADTSYWIRQTIPFAGGGRAIGVNGRNGLLNSLRSSKEQGQSNFNNPGLILAGLGADFDLTPELRVSANANHLWFADTATLEALRNQPNIDRSIGYDLSASAIWRPNANQNIVFRLSGATLLAGEGFRELFTARDGGRRFFSIVANVVLTY